MIKYFGAAFAALLLSGAANAASLTYDLTGTFDNGSSLIGSFDFDGAQTGANQFSNVNVVIPGYFGFDRVYGNNVGRNAADSYVYFYAGRTGDYFKLVFPTTTVAGVTSVTGTELDSKTFAYYFYGIHHLTDGTITLATPAVPEPATWGLMLMGFGGLGYAMRRRPAVRARIRFA